MKKKKKKNNKKSSSVEIFFDNMKNLLQDNFQKYLESLEKERPVAIQVNTSKVSISSFLKLKPFCTKPVIWCDNGLYVTDSTKPAKSPFYYAGLFYIQDASAMSSVSALDPAKGDKVIDVCSAPGGKTLQIANKVGNNGLILSNDISASRLKVLIKNIELFGVKNNIITAEDVSKLSFKQPNYYDKVLLDAPCSCEGMFRKDKKIQKSWNEKSAEAFSKIQKKLILESAKLLKNNGSMLYSTCTFSTTENEEVIKYMLDNSDMIMDNILNFEGFAEGIEIEGDIRTKLSKRLYPFQVEGEGHFLAKLKKNTNDPNIYTSSLDTQDYITITYKNKTKKIGFNNPPKEFLDFQERVLSKKIQGVFRLHGEKLLLEPPCVPDLTNIRVLRRGWYLGDITKHGFIPSQALAMGLSYDDILEPLNFVRNSKEIELYLKCSSFELRQKDGLYIVCVEKYPLGFAKVKDNILKSLYPHSWRMV